MRVFCDSYCIEINGFDVHVMLRVIIFACICQRVYLGIIIHYSTGNYYFCGYRTFLWTSYFLVDITHSCGRHIFLWISYSFVLPYIAHWRFYIHVNNMYVWMSHWRLIICMYGRHVGG